MCKTISTKNEHELNADVENKQTPKNNTNYDTQKNMSGKINKDSLDDQTSCFVLGYN
jgi:hypothetical protein